MFAKRTALLVVAGMAAAACSQQSAAVTVERVTTTELEETRVDRAPVTYLSNVVKPTTTKKPTTTTAPTTAPTTTAAPTTAPVTTAAVTTTTAPQGVLANTDDVKAANSQVTDGPVVLPFASVAGITLYHPATWVDRIGYHESNHEGAQDQVASVHAVNYFIMPSRGRIAGEASAADVVVRDGQEILSPVSGTVKRAGTYTLYCDITDSFLVVAPDAQPNWEVKMLHISGLKVAVGDRVEGGKTLVASGPTALPFGSQVDAYTDAQPPRHVHIEVVNPAIPNISNPGSGGC